MTSVPHPETVAQGLGAISEQFPSAQNGAFRRHALGRVSRRTSNAWTSGALGLDLAMLFLAAIGTAIGGTAVVASPPAVWVLAFSLFVVLVLASRGLYSLPVRIRVLDDLRTVAIATTVAAMVVLTLRLLLQNPPHVGAQTARLWVFATIYLAAGRVALSLLHVNARREHELTRPTLIVGAGKTGHLTARRLLESPELGLEPVAFLDKEPLFDEQTLGLPVAGASWDLEDVVTRYGIQHAIVTFSTAPNDVLLRLTRRCAELGVSVSVVPRMYEQVAERLSVEHLGAMPLLTSHSANPRGWEFGVKYVLDRLVAFALLVLVAPVFLLVALAVRLTMGRPVMFRQTRVGRDGQPFEMLKFRSMRNPTEGATSFVLPDGLGPGGVEGADRRTPVGRFLRGANLDELPQLLNVLKGEMSLVGPRPERPEFVARFEESVYRYSDRHRVKAGITGWAQVHGLRGRTSISDRAEWDNFYVENFSLWLDVKILLMTAAAVARGLFPRVS